MRRTVHSGVSRWRKEGGKIGYRPGKRAKGSLQRAACRLAVGADDGQETGSLFSPWFS